MPVAEPRAPGYDAFLLVSFGGPEGPDDVIPFLENVSRGSRGSRGTSSRGIPRERLAEVGEHYYLFGGVSPINQQCRELIAAIEARFAACGMDLPVYWGNRNWTPYLTDTVRQMARAGVGRAVAFATSAYSSYSGCRQYLEDIERAREQAGPGAPQIDKLRPYFNHPGFVEPLAENTRAALATLSAAVRDNACLVFTAHSVPTAMADSSGPADASPDGAPDGSQGGAPEGSQGGAPDGSQGGAPDGSPGGAPDGSPGGAYVAQLTEVARLVSERVDGGRHPWRLVFQSRSGPPSQPWLEPDVGDYLAELAGAGAQAAVLVPSGFVSDHMEVRYDLDVVAARIGERLGIQLARAATPGAHPRFVAMVSELVAERFASHPQRPALGCLRPNPDQCPAGCCARGGTRAGASTAHSGRPR